MSCVQRFCLQTSWQNTTSLSWLQTLLHQTMQGYVHRQQNCFQDCLWSHQDKADHQAVPCFIPASRSCGTFAVEPFLWIHSHRQEQWQELWQFLSHLSAVLHRPVTNQLPCHACLQHWHCIKHLQPVAEVFLDKNIQWSNLVSCMSDNCIIMTGKNNSVVTRIKEKTPSVFDLGCVCHLANLCAITRV